MTEWVSKMAVLISLMGNSAAGLIAYDMRRPSVGDIQVKMLGGK